MRKKMRMFLVIALTLCLVITMIPGLSYAAVKEETKDAEDVVTHEESHDAPLPDIIKVKLMNEDLTKEDQSDGHTTYSFGGNRKLMVFDVGTEGDHSNVIKVSKDHEPILEIGELSELLSDKYIENVRLYLYEYKC